MLYGNDLIDQVSTLFRAAEKRIWISVPYIGSWSSVQRIMGTKWIGNLNVDVRVLTDISNKGGLSRDSVRVLQNRAEIRSLVGLHAKVYLLDNKLVLTSANLTGTAFSRRWEIGHIFDATKRNISFFEQWWKKADPVETTWLPSRADASLIDHEEGSYRNLPQLWDLPAPEVGAGIFSSYLNQIKVYDHFRKLYLKCGKRVLPWLPIYQEIDDFMNYLYHEHELLPSRAYVTRSFRRITDDKRARDLREYMVQYRKWKGPSPTAAKDDRLERIKIIQLLLGPS